MPFKLKLYFYGAFIVKLSVTNVTMHLHVNIELCLMVGPMCDSDNMLLI